VSKTAKRGDDYRMVFSAAKPVGGTTKKQLGGGTLYKAGSKKGWRNAPRSSVGGSKKEEAANRRSFLLPGKGRTEGHGLSEFLRMGFRKAKKRRATHSRGAQLWEHSRKEKHRNEKEGIGQKSTQKKNCHDGQYPSVIKEKLTQRVYLTSGTQQ